MKFSRFLALLISIWSFNLKAQDIISATSEDMKDFDKLIEKNDQKAAPKVFHKDGKKLDSNQDPRGQFNGYADPKSGNYPPPLLDSNGRPVQGPPSDWNGHGGPPPGGPPPGGPPPGGPPPGGPPQGPPPH